MNDSKGLPERKVEDPEAFVAQIKAKAAAEREQRLKAAAGLKAEAEAKEKTKPTADVVSMRDRAKALVAQSQKVRTAELHLEAKRQEPQDGKAKNEEEALHAEVPVAASDLGPEEEKRRRVTRWMKLLEVNRKCAVVREYGGKCVIVTEGRSPINPNRKIFVYQSKDAFEHWMANEFIPSLERKNKTDLVGPWWWKHPKRRQYDGVVFKPLASPIVQTPDRQLLLNTYLGWGVEPKQGDWSLIRQHIKEVLANGDTCADDYIVRWTAWGIQHPDMLPLVALVLIGYKGRGKGTFARVLERVFGDHSLQISNQRHIVGNFNAHLENLILMISDEAFWAGHKADAGTLQRMITEPTLAIEAKGYDVRTVKNYVHLLMLAEPGWTVPAGQDGDVHCSGWRGRECR